MDHELTHNDEDWGCTCGEWSAPASMDEATAIAEHELHTAPAPDDDGGAEDGS